MNITQNISTEFFSWLPHDTDLHSPRKTKQVRSERVAAPPRGFEDDYILINLKKDLMKKKAQSASCSGVSVKMS